MNLKDINEYYYFAAKHEFCDSDFETLITDIKNNVLGPDTILIRFEEEGQEQPQIKNQVRIINAMLKHHEIKSSRKDLNGNSILLLSNQKISAEALINNYNVDECYTKGTDPNAKFIDPTTFGYQYAIVGFYDAEDIDPRENY